MKSKGARVLAKALKREGVSCIFTLSGIPLFDIYDACIDEGIRVVDTRHEQGAVHAASGWARIKREAGVALVTPGPGVVNAFTGIVNAWSCGIPTIVLAGQISLSNYETGAFHEMEQSLVMKPITKWSSTVYLAERIPEYVNLSFKHALSGKPGPVFLDIPEDVLEKEVDVESLYFPKPFKKWSRPKGSCSEIEKAISLLKESKKPLMIAGSGVIWSDAADELVSFANQIKIPTITTPLGRGIVPDDHPLCVFSARSEATREADLILCVGARFNFILGFGRPPKFREDAKVIQIDIDEFEIGRNRSVDVGIVGDAKEVLTQMLSLAKEQGIEQVGDESWLKFLQNRVREKKGNIPKRYDLDKIPINPVRICVEVNDICDENTIIIVDGGAILDFARSIIGGKKAGKRLNPGVFGLLGIGIPYGIGAKLASPKDKVIVICGDGAFGLCAMEFDTAVRHNVPIVVIVSNNAGWGLSFEYQKIHYGEERVVGSLLKPTRYDRIAEEMGGVGIFVEKPKDIRPALERALAEERPVLINVITDPDTRFYSVSFQLKSEK